MPAVDVFAVPVPALGVWVPELVLTGTILLGLLAGTVRRGAVVRLLVIVGLAVAAVMAASQWPADAIQPLGPHFTVDRPAALTRLAILLASLLTVLNLPGPERRGAVLLAVASLGLIWLAEAATVGGLLLAVGAFVAAAPLTAWFAAAPAARGAVRRWHMTAAWGLAFLTFGAILWSGLARTLDLAVSLDKLALRPFLTPLALPAILACCGAGLVLALLGDPGRFAPVERESGEGSANEPGAASRLAGDRADLPPALTGWLTAVPPLALIALLDRLLQAVPPVRLFSAVPDLLTWAAAVLLAGGFLAAATCKDLQRRLSWAATGQVGLALLGLSVRAEGHGPDAVMPLMLVFAAAQLGALLLTGVIGRLEASRRQRYFLPFLLAGMLLALAALPPLAGWRPRLALLQGLLASGSYLGAGLALGGTLLGCFVYLRPLVDLWRQDAKGPADADRSAAALTGEPVWAAAALLCAAALLAVLLAWGIGLLQLPGLSG